MFISFLKRTFASIWIIVYHSSDNFTSAFYRLETFLLQSPPYFQLSTLHHCISTLVHRISPFCPVASRAVCPLFNIPLFPLPTPVNIVSRFPLIPSSFSPFPFLLCYRPRAFVDAASPEFVQFSGFTFTFIHKTTSDVRAHTLAKMIPCAIRGRKGAASVQGCLNRLGATRVSGEALYYSRVVWFGSTPAHFHFTPIYLGMLGPGVVFNCWGVLLGSTVGECG